MQEIEKIIRHYEEARVAGERLALGTVVSVSGSSYRRIGARLLVGESGRWTGGISGGCLEGDALKRAKQSMLGGEAKLVVYDTREDDPHQIGVGLGCRGRIEVLFVPLVPTNENNQLEFFKGILDRRKPSVILQFLEDGKFYAGDDLETAAAALNISPELVLAGVARARANHKSSVVTLESRDGQAHRVLIEYVRPKIRLVCVGDNYDVNALVAAACGLGWAVELVGKRKKISRETHRLLTTFTELSTFSGLAADPYTAVVLMSHDYRTDYRILKETIALPLRYLGLLGPKDRSERIRAELLAEGFPLDLRDQAHFRSPVGLDVGAETPEEIALSIVAEIISVFRGREAGFLKDRAGSIYED